MHPDQEALKDLIIGSGFDDCKFYNLLNGIVAIHVGYKEQD
jgi:demethylmenaquinone methyltransferase/2-methoxy-6-polyprenyl-1,4-benzoquinol methylase